MTSFSLPSAMRIRICLFLMFAVLGLASAPGLFAQPPRVQPPAEQPTEPGEKKPELPPEPERMSFETKDGVILSAVYYGPKKGVRPGKRTVPMILIHGWDGQGAEFDYLARGLQTYGHAIIVPDLRGHGRSMKVRIPGRDDKTIDRDRISPKAMMEGMIQDIEAVKKFLLEKNNEGDVNIELLCVVGAEEGAIIAMNWALADWSWRQLPAFKQGQDVKAAILLSPTRQFKGVNANAALINPLIVKNVSKMICVGSQETSAMSDAKRVFKGLERLHPPLPKEPEDRVTQQDLYFFPIDTNLQGTKLLQRDLPVNKYIVGFIGRRLLNRSDDFPWKERRSPLTD